MIVALIGNDGCGKTSVAKRLEEKYPHKVIYTNLFEQLLILRFLLQPFKKRRARHAKKHFFTRNVKHGLLTQYIWPLLVLADAYIIYLYLQVRYFSQTVVTDRYPYSYCVSWTYYNIGNPFIRKLYLRFPKPNQCIILETLPEECFRRKKYQAEIRGEQYDIEFFTHHHALYQAFSNKVECTALSTGTESLEEVVTRVEKEIPTISEG